MASRPLVRGPLLPWPIIAADSSLHEREEPRQRDHGWCTPCTTGSHVTSGVEVSRCSRAAPSSRGSSRRSCPMSISRSVLHSRNRSSPTSASVPGGESWSACSAIGCTRNPDPANYRSRVSSSAKRRHWHCRTTWRSTARRICGSATGSSLSMMNRIESRSSFFTVSARSSIASRADTVLSTASFSFPCPRSTTSPALPGRSSSRPESAGIASPRAAGSNVPTDRSRPSGVMRSGFFSHPWAHNQYAAERDFGERHMVRFRTERTGGNGI